MKDIAEELKKIIVNVKPQLDRMNHRDVAIRPSPEEWSKKEILGHLIDSAANNHQRFVRAVYNAADQFPTYDQKRWVEIQQCNEIPWAVLIGFWEAYNLHLSHIIACIPSDAESFPCNIGEKEPVSLHYIVKDYLCHMRHHLEDILNTS